MRSLIAISLLTLSATAQAEPIEVWECTTESQGNITVQVTATVEAGGKTGHISLAGIAHDTVFEVAGFDRRWDFGVRADRTFRYAFVIDPEGHAKYFDFGNNETKVQPMHYMKCRQTRAAKALN